MPKSYDSSALQRGSERSDDFLIGSHQAKNITNFNYGLSSSSFYVVEDVPSEPEGSNGYPRLKVKGTQRRLPAALIIGVRKCGTRALLEMLNLHPNIRKRDAEVHFFDDDDRYNKGLEWYRKKMPVSFDNQVQRYYFNINKTFS
ncbi:hypothetical protein HAZT_HAZT007945 [Hyalella azteca]|uniref:Sulfotransferase domain-containing protein n=1 Tax=Hyalella azteca TaxID=294128 RepID=A0A6A0HA14_HYAAZ|nr:hypothetical protein HAZT_HAZT007945 [Hyalella azteca]